MEELGITDRHRLKNWMRKFKELSEFGLMDQRGRRDEYIDKDRYVQQLKRENSMLKKAFKNLDRGDEKRKYKAIEKAAIS